MKKLLAASCCAIALAGCATSYTVSPVADADESVSYVRGLPTTVSDKKSGSVQVTPLGVAENGRMRFGVAAYNKSLSATNFGYENVALATVDGKAVKLFSRTQLEKEAKNAAAWAAVAVALSGAANAYAASQSAYTTTQGTIYGAGRPVSYTQTTYNPALANALANENIQQTGAQMASVRASLDGALASLNDGHILEITTIQPGQSYGGAVITDSLKGDAATQQVVMKVTLNGEDHTFKFNVTKSQ